MDAIRRCYYDGESIESVSRDIGYTPGEFHITPVKVTVESNTITDTVATDSVVLDKNDVEKGLYVVTEGSFSPKVIRNTGVLFTVFEVAINFVRL